MRLTVHPHPRVFGLTGAPPGPPHCRQTESAGPSPLVLITMLFDYTKVTAESIEQDLTATLAEADALIAQIVDHHGDRTFANTLAAAERASQLVAGAYGRGPFLGEASPDEGIRNMARSLDERLSKWGVELAFRDDLYAAVAAYATTEDAEQLTGERRRLLEFTMRDFRMAGHELPAEKRETLKAHNQRLVELSVAFATNIAEYEDFLVVTRADLAGLPDSYIENLKPGEKENTYCVSMAYPDVVPFIENVKNRDLREALQRKFNNRAAATNRPILEEAVAIRKAIADLFGVDSWAHHSMQQKMAKNPEAVFGFYDSIVPGLTTQAKEEIARMTELLSSETGASELQLWDWRYYDTALRRDEYGVDSQKVAEYLSLDEVVAGMLDLTGEMFGVTYQPVEPANAWHEDVTLWRVSESDGGELVGHFYMDLFPREGKFSHAAAWDLVPGYQGPDGYVRPISAILANFPKPTPERPSLLQHDDVVTLFHEFGHILHMTFTTAEIRRFSGAGTEWDFVEAPSQIMENWCWKPQILRRFAKHHETGVPIPDELVAQLADARYLNESLAKLRQVTYGMLDMYLHGPVRPDSLDEAIAKASEFSLLPQRRRHVLLGIVRSSVRLRRWLLRLSVGRGVWRDDMFSRFEEEGIDNPQSRIGVPQTGFGAERLQRRTRPCTGFPGREPSSEPFLHKLGIE